ncbi:P-loop containing nucleoside triphosphate hydrolase protein [Polychytrium aggregatum]|uniref:P-loop containing nucleoside triphosphate hydrolase protein n=1 Tax=Polychytrium aggregatum TaxID=110093 RepID=UPI0022FF0564|nr:P-loop containing nucleoside triphosphate hydrolase protein [Polychytrium aggregatum]KAI9205967.1 P-loop containing nucleoside triphosphate hydrolase protein [Polychytrium aggregatum]
MPPKIVRSANQGSGKSTPKESGASKKGKDGSGTPEAPPAPPKLFGSWTGKTPVSLLHEHCQKFGWRKPEYQISSGVKGHRCAIVVSLEDKKTKEIRSLRFWNGQYYQSDQEAKHTVATYTLFKFFSHLSLNRLLPPSQSSYWAELAEAQKTEGVDTSANIRDPFKAEEMRQSGKQPGRGSSSAPTPDSAAKTPAPESRPTRDGDAKTDIYNLPVLNMSKEMRFRIEELLKQEHQRIQRNHPLADGGGLSEDTSQMLLNKYVRIGFRKPQVEEGLQFAKTDRELLDWLCIHVPEDDLPAKFMPKIESDIVGEKNTTQSLGRNYAISRLHRSGYSRRMCERALDEALGNEVLALSLLTKAAISHQTPEESSVEITPEEQKEMIDQEVEVLVSIYGEDAVKASPTVVSVTIEDGSVAEKTTLEVHITESYPHDIPGIVVLNPSLPTYIRLSITKGLASECASLVGFPLVGALSSWLEGNLASIVASPPPLVSIVANDGSIGGSTAAEPSSTVDASGLSANSTSKRSKAKSAPSNRSKPPINLCDADGKLSLELLKQYEQQARESEFINMFEKRKKLPSYKFRDQIIESVLGSQVVIICGETGCGKSTQVGQFILESMYTSKRAANCSIICTQPRRISAMSLAERVASERNEKMGSTVGYAIRGETVRSERTRLLFCTTGILLRMLHNDRSLDQVSHIIIDEVHERGVESDFLLVILRDLLAQRKDLKLVLMSATINATTFSEYFKDAPVLEIPGFTHPVKDIYLESILKETGYMVKSTKGRGKASIEQTSELEDLKKEYTDEGYDDQTMISLMRAEKESDRINYELIAQVVRHIMSLPEDDGAILIFMPGVMEIKKCIDQIKSEVTDCGRLQVLPLHANLSTKEQSLVFKNYGKGCRKIIVSTNIAETSITIDDVVFVIDAGKVKEMNYDGQMMALVETWASRASCKQRRGRAGRVRPGFCFKLYTKKLEQRKMPAQALPEILRIPLEQLCLQVLALGYEDPQIFLRKALDPPAVENITKALNTLKDLNAVNKSSGTLTALGKHLATIPADLRIAKMLLFGCILNCLDPILTIAACMSTKSPFVSPMDSRDEAKEARGRFSEEQSDWLTDNRAFDEWKQVREEGKAAERRFCEQNFLSQITLSAIADLRQQYFDNLVDIGFVESDSKRPVLDQCPRMNSNSQSPKIIKAALLAGLYPNVVLIENPPTTYVETPNGSVAQLPEASEIKFRLERIGRTFVHPTSINFSARKFDSPFIVFHQMVSTSKVFLRDTTTISPWPILMFGGPLSMDHNHGVVRVGGNISLQAFPRIAVLVNGIRTLLDAILEDKIRDPKLVVYDQAPIQLIQDLFLCDGA